MSTLSYYEPFITGQGGLAAFVQQAYIPLQNAAWRRADFLIQKTTGTIVVPPGPGGGTSTLKGVAGPAASAVTITQTASAGAPAQTYYIVVTYAATGLESGPSQEFVVNSQAGFVPTVNVAAAGAPAGATSYNLYEGLFPSTEVKQNAAIVALGTPTNTPNPLTNNSGITRAATAPTTGIVGLAINNSSSVYFSGTGGSSQVGEQSLFGATNSLPPLNPAEIYLGYVVKLQQQSVVEISLINTTAWSPMLQGTAVGLTYDTATGFFIADPGAAAVAVIAGGSDGDFRTLGQTGDYGKRILISNFTAGALA